jgi:Uma2 family endonuclease
MSVHARQMTVEEFWELYADKPYELIHGEVKEIVPPGYSHGSIARRTAAKLGDFVDKHQLGDVVVEGGFQLSSTVMVVPDAAFIGNVKLAQITEPQKYLPFAPDLAVEVVSPNDTANEIQDKVNLYLAAGTALVWVMYPAHKQVAIHRSDHTSKTVSKDGTLDGGDVLPGLKLSVSTLFPPDQERTQEPE